MRYTNNNPRLCVIVFIALTLMLGAVSCKRPHQKDDFDVNLLYGKWQEGTVFERYYKTDSAFILPSGDTVQANGTTWDEGDDISEEEAQIFKWTLDGTKLVQEHIGTFVIVPKIYTITSLSPSELTYSDDYGTTHHYTKVE